MNSLKVNHIPFSVSFQQLKHEFEHFGRCKVVLHTGNNGENYAYVNYYDVLDAEDALQQMNQTTLCGKKITVKRQYSSSSASYSVTEQYTVKVTELSKETTKETLNIMFKVVSPDAHVLSVKINEGHGEFNWAYVNYNSLNDAQKAVQLYNGTKIDSSKIRVKMQESLRHTEMPIVNGYSPSPSLWHPQNPAAATCFSSGSAPVSTDCSTIKVTMHTDSLSVQDLEKVFGEFGALKDKPKVLKGMPNYAYINYVSPLNASDACSGLNDRKFKDVRLFVTLSTESEHLSERKGIVRVHKHTIGTSHKQIVCDPLLVRLITSRIDRFTEQLKSITQSPYVPVSIAPMKSGNGISISGRSEHLEVVELFVKELIAKLKVELKVEHFSLQCQYIPLFRKTEIAKTFSDVEERFVVEFCVVNNDTKRSIPVNAFSSLVSEKLFSKSDKTAKTSSLPMFLSTPTSHASEDLWSWQTDDGSFTPYSPDISAKLNKEFKLTPNGSFSCEILTKMGTIKYTIDFSSMTQKNKCSKSVRSIQCIPGAGNAEWLYENEGGRLIPFPSKESEEIEKLKDSTKPSILVIDGTAYVFDFSQMTRTNEDTNEECAIHRKITSKPSDGLCICFSINGLPEDILTATECLKSELSKAIVRKEISLPTPIEKTGMALQKTARQYFVSAEIVNGKLQLKGVEGYLEKVLLVITEQKHAYEKQMVSQGMASAQTVELPEHWEPQTEKIELKPVQQGSPEWNKVASRFHKTLPQEDITSIERIQNKWQWDRYSFSKQRMFEKNRGTVNEKELFHGTRDTPPEKVFKSEQGFDFRFASSGMWGTGTYFAVNASYSEKYAYRNRSMQKFILAKVLTGETYRCAPNGSLKKPPVKKHNTVSKPSSSSLPGMFTFGLMANATPSSNDLDTKGDFEDELYDSVSGSTGDSDIFVIYDHEKAYPAYLITFR